MANELVNTSEESQYAASSVQYNSSDIVLSRVGTHLRSNAVAGPIGGVTGSAAWVGELTSGITNPSFSFAGVVSEIIVFNRKLSETERQEVYGYLARKYPSLESSLPDSFRQSHSSGYQNGVTYWTIEHHPNTKGLTDIPAGICFDGITLEKFFSMPETIYKSEGTVLASGVGLTTDTYTQVGQ